MHCISVEWTRLMIINIVLYYNNDFYTHILVLYTKQEVQWNLTLRSPH